MSDKTSRDYGYDLIVIGGGTAGMAVARQVGRAGKRVALIEANKTGGECLYTGCVPSKSLIASARVVAMVRRADEFGVSASAPTVDMARVVRRTNAIIRAAGEPDTPEAIAKDGVEVIAGTARFVDPHTVAVDDRRLRAEQLVIATGSQPAVPPVDGLSKAGFLTHEGILELCEVPRRLAVIGAGPVGLELGQAFLRFGSAVTVVDHRGRVLSGDDVDNAADVRKALEAEGMTFHLGSRVSQVKGTPDGKRLTVERGDGRMTEVEVDEILVATGRTPNVDSLNLGAAGVTLTPTGVRVDGSLRTSVEHIWACGDVTGPPYYTHAADAQGRTVATGVLGGKANWDGRAVPWVTFTEPEIAGVGLTEERARERYGRKLEVLTLPYGRVDRALTDGQEAGRIKVLLAPGWLRGRVGGEVVGAHVVGANAGEVVQQFAFMMAWRLPAGMLAKTVQSYPTYSLGGRQAVGIHWHRKPGSTSTPSFVSRLLAKVT